MSPELAEALVFVHDNLELDVNWKWEKPVPVKREK